jgi:hypothetical protein
MERRVEAANSSFAFFPRHRRAFIIIAIIAVASLAAWRAYRDVWFETILLSPDSGYEGGEHMFLIIRDEIEWRKVWGLATADYVSPPKLPEVDFSRYTVIAVFQAQGIAPSAIRIEGITRGWDGSLTVKVVNYVPPPGWALHLTVVSPVHIVKIGRMDGKIHFEITERYIRKLPIFS